MEFFRNKAIPALIAAHHVLDSRESSVRTFSFSPSGCFECDVY